jgi:tetratricopeptide (TPR) repeat protein
MEVLRAGAFRVYLQHALSSALTVDSIVRQRYDRSEEYRIDTTVASATWVRYCRNVQTLCGVYGLIAIDRAESRLLHCFEHQRSFYFHDGLVHEELVQKYEKAAHCYTNAVIRQRASDSFNAALWSYAGGVYDRADPSNLTVIDCSNDNKPNSDEEEKEWNVLALKYESLPENPSAVSHLAEFKDLRRDIALYYRTALAQSAVSLALSTQQNYGYYDTSKAREAATRAHHLVRALEYTQKALQCTGMGARVPQAFWNLCASYMRSAAEEKSSTRSWRWYNRATSLSTVVEKLTALIPIMESLPAATSVEEKIKLKQQVTQICKCINESKLVTGTQGIDSYHHHPFDTADIERLLRGISVTLQGLTSVETAEQRMMKGFVAAADQVNVDQSPAHPHIKQCWLNAAELMRLAIAAVDDYTGTHHKKGGFRQERFALGPLATAAGYFARARSTAATPQAQSLWNEAARLQLDASVALVARPRKQWEERVEFTGDEWKQVQRARELAEAATCCVRVSRGTATPLQLAEAKLRLAVVGEFAQSGEAYGRKHLRSRCADLLKWCAELSPATLTPPLAPDEPEASGEDASAGWLDITPPSAEQRVKRAVWLCGVLTHLVEVYSTDPGSLAVFDAADKIYRRLSEYFEEVLDSSKIYVSPENTADIDVTVETLVETRRKLVENNRPGADPEVQCRAQSSVPQFSRSDERVTRYVAGTAPHSGLAGAPGGCSAQAPVAAQHSAQVLRFDTAGGKRKRAGEEEG